MNPVWRARLIGGATQCRKGFLGCQRLARVELRVDTLQEHVLLPLSLCLRRQLRPRLDTAYFLREVTQKTRKVQLCLLLSLFQLRLLGRCHLAVGQLRQTAFLRQLLLA